MFTWKMTAKRVYWLHMASREWSSDNMALSCWETLVVYSRLSAMLERDGRFGMSFSYNVTKPGNGRNQCQSYSELLHWWTSWWASSIWHIKKPCTVNPKRFLFGRSTEGPCLTENNLLESSSSSSNSKVLLDDRSHLSKCCLLCVVPIVTREACGVSFRRDIHQYSGWAGPSPARWWFPADYTGCRRVCCRLLYRFLPLLLSCLTSTNNYWYDVRSVYTKNW